MRNIKKMNCPQRNMTESEKYVGVQTFMEIKDEELVEVVISKF